MFKIFKKKTNRIFIALFSILFLLLVVVEGVLYFNLYGDAKLEVLAIKPDLIVKKVSVSNKNPKIGDEVTVTAEISNKSFAKSSSFVVSAINSGSGVNLETKIDSLPKGKTIKVPFKFRVSNVNKNSLSTEFTIVADPYDYVKEKIETNNIKSLKISVQYNPAILEPTGDSTQNKGVTLLWTDNYSSNPSFPALKYELKLYSSPTANPFNVSFYTNYTWAGMKYYLATPNEFLQSNIHSFAKVPSYKIDDITYNSTDKFMFPDSGFRTYVVEITDLNTDKKVYSNVVILGK